MPRNGLLSRHKRTKMGQLPGEFNPRWKARVLETGQPFYAEYPHAAKTFKRDYVRKANRRVRHQLIQEE